MKIAMKLLSACTLFWLAGSAYADGMALEKVAVSGDLAALERGADTVIDTCTVCHSLKYISFRDLAALGIANDKVQAWRGDSPMGSAIASKMTVDSALLAFGAVPPDLSLIANAREGGANYVYSFLLGFYATPDGIISNHYFPGTKMPDTLAIAGVTDAAQRALLEQKARDVTSFLVWAADPHAQERQTLGYYVIGYLLLLTTLLYLLKRRIWARLNPIQQNYLKEEI